MPNANLHPQPVAVMSTLTGNVVDALSPQFPELEAFHIASALAILAGAITFFIGVIRIGWIVDMIPLISLSAFMTGSALNILVGQVPTMLGETFPSPWTTRDPTYRVIINTLKYLPTAKLDAAMGLTALVMLYAIRWACQFVAKKYPKHQKIMFFVSTLRTVFVILLYTMISWLANMHSRSSPKFKILGSVPRGKSSLELFEAGNEGYHIANTVYRFPTCYCSCAEQEAGHRSCRIPALFGYCPFD